MLNPKLKAALADELNGEIAMRHVEEITQYHRSLGSREYHEACDYLRAYFADEGIEVLELDAPLDNETRIGNYTVPPAWEPKDAIVKVVDPEERVIVSFKEAPTCINSWSAATPPEGVTADLVYVGNGDSDQDYQGKNVEGQICLVDRGFAWRTHPLAVEKYGALGFLNDDVLAMPPLKTRETFPDAVMWNTLYERSMEGGFTSGFGVSISPRMGDYLRGLLEKGPVKVHVRVEAETFKGTMENPMAVIRGSDHPEEEVLLTSHLCHTRPGAVDNAAGCAHITETMRAINTLIRRGDLPQPRRSLVALYGPEGHHTNVYGAKLENEGRLDDFIAGLSSHAGGDPESLRSPLVLTRTSPARPHFVDDLMTYCLEQIPDVFPSPGPRARVPFSFVVEPRFMGGDSLQLVGWGLPSIELARRPNIFWHTQYDTADKCSAEEFLKVGWVFGTAAWFMATAGPAETLWLIQLVEARSETRLRQVCHVAGEEMAGSTDEEHAATLERRVDELHYLAQRDGEAIRSCLVFVRHEPVEVREMLEAEASRYVERLEKAAREAEDELLALAKLERAS